MDETIIANWNNAITNDDTVYIIGDLFKSTETAVANSYLSRLNGKKTLILGNHDEFTANEDFDPNYFLEITSYKELSIDGLDLVLFHYPIIEWRGKKDGAICLHGHTHNTTPSLYMDNLIDVGVDAHDFCPVSLQAIIGMVKTND